MVVGVVVVKGSSSESTADGRISCSGMDGSSESTADWSTFNFKCSMRRGDFKLVG